MVKKLLLATNKGLVVFRPERPGGKDFPGRQFVIPNPNTGDTWIDDSAQSVHGLAFSPDGTQLALTHGSSSSPFKFLVFDVASREVDTSWPSAFSGIPQNVQWSQDGAEVSFAAIGIRVLSATTKSVVRHHLSTTNVRTHRWAPGDAEILVGWGSTPRLTTFTRAGTQLTGWTAPTAAPSSIAVNAAKTRLAAAVGGATIWVYNYATRVRDTTFVADPGLSYRAVTWRPGDDNQLIFYCSRAGFAELAIYDATTKAVQYVPLSFGGKSWGVSLSCAMTWWDQDRLILTADADTDYGFDSNDQPAVAIYNVATQTVENLLIGDPQPANNYAGLTRGLALAVFEDPIEDPIGGGVTPPVEERSRRVITTDDIPPWEGQPAGSALTVGPEGALVWQVT